MGIDEEVASVISELQAGVDRSLFGSLTILRTRLIKSTYARAKLLQLNAAKLLLNLLGERTRHGNQKKLPDLVMSILANLCLDNIASAQILKCGGLETIATFTLAAEYESIQNRGARALSNLAQHEGVVEELFNLEVPEFVTMRLLETEDEECRVTYCRAIRQIGKTDSAVRRLVEDTVAVQALAAMLKLDKKTLALKGLRTLAELSALRCCAQFAGQVLAAKVEEELVNFSEEDDSDMAYFALSLIFRLCEQGLVRPSLGAAGVVKLLVRLMSSTRRHVNRVSVLNSLCLCSLDSVNRNRILEAGGLEVFVSVLKGEEKVQVLSCEVGNSESSPSTSGNKDKAMSVAAGSSGFHDATEDNIYALKKSRFHVLYDRIIGCLVNFIYHDKCFAKLADLGIVDVLLIHLQRCSNYQINNYADLKSESDIMTNEISGENQNLDRQLMSGKLPTEEFNTNQLGSNDKSDSEIANIPKDSVNEFGYMENASPNRSGRSRHESRGFEFKSISEISAQTDIDTVENSLIEESDHDMASETIDIDEEEDKISKNIYSRDPLNIDTQDLSSQNPPQRGNAPLESAESAAGNFSEESDASASSSRKVKHTFSINSPTYQSEISRRSEDAQSSGVTCKDYSTSGSLLLLPQGASPSSLLNPSWPASPANATPSQLSSPRGIQSPFSPLSAHASYYSPTQSSPPYSCVPFSPPSSLPPHSPPSSSSQAGLSPALSWVSSSATSPGQRSLTSPSPVHIPPYQSPPAGAPQGSFSPLSAVNFPGSPLHMNDANFQGQEVVSPSLAAEVAFPSSPGLFSDTSSQVDPRSSQNQALPVLSFGVETLTQGTLASASPIYSATDDEDDDEDNEKNNTEPTTSSTSKDYYSEGHLMSITSDQLDIDRDEVLLTPNTSKADAETALECEDLDLSINNIQTPRACLHATATGSKEGKTVSGSNKTLSSLGCDPVDGDNSPRKRLKVKSSSSSPVSSPGVIPASTQTLEGSMQSPQGSMAMMPSRDKKLVPRSSKVAKKFQRMLSAPCPETTIQSQIGFKKRAPIGQLGAKDSMKTEESEASTSAVLGRTNSQNTIFSSPSSACSPASTQDTVAASSSKQDKALFSTFTPSKHKERRGRASDEKLRKIKQTTESNIFILLSSCSVRPGILSKLIKTDVLVNLLSYIRNAPTPLQRCFRILKRLFSNQLIFYRLILAHTSTLIIKSLILEDDGTFPKTMFCTEWEDLFGQLRRSRMNLSDLLPFNKSSDDGSASGSQVSDFGQRLDFEFGGDAYTMARTMSSSNTLAHRMFRDLYHNIRSLSTESQNAWDIDSISQGSDLIYQPGVPREETRVRVGLKLLACLSTVATSSYGEGEIQHLSQGGKSAEQLSCRIFMLHTPVVWGRMIRHQFALKHQLSWDALLPYLFSDNIPMVVKTAIFIGLSFNLHLDFPPKLVKQMGNPAPCPDLPNSKSFDVAGTRIPGTRSVASTSKSHSMTSEAVNVGEISTARIDNLATESGASVSQTRVSDSSLRNMDKTSCSSACQSPGLFDEDEEDERNISSSHSQHQKCVYWRTAANHNVTFIIKENGITYRHRANRATMMQRSEVFAAMLGGAYAERLKSEIELTDTKAASFEYILHYLHGCTSSACSLLSFLSSNEVQLRNLSGLRSSLEERLIPSSNSDIPASPGAKKQVIENNSLKVKSDASQVIETVNFEESHDNSMITETSDKESRTFTPTCSTSDYNRAYCNNTRDQMCDSKTKSKTELANSDIELRDSGEAFRLVEELTNICSDVLVLADRYLLTELVNRICSALSHVCLRAHTWEDLFKLASVFKLRPLAVDCMREALLVYEKPAQIVKDLQSLGEDGYTDQAVEALGLLLKSARIH